MSYTGRLVIDADSVTQVGQQPPPSGGAELTLDGQGFNCVFNEDFSEPFDTWKDKVYEWETDPNALEQRWCAKHSVGSFGTDGIQFLHWSQTPNPNDLMDIIDGQLHMRVRDDVRANPGDWAGSLLATVGPHTTSGWNGYRQVGGYIEARMKSPPQSPTGGGHWVALWTISAENHGPRQLLGGQQGTDPFNTAWHLPELEDDIMEHWVREKTKIYPNAHYRSAQGNLNLRIHNHTGDMPFDTGVDLTADFHRFGVWHRPKEWRYYFDGQHYATVHLDGDPKAIWARERAHYLLINHTIDTRGGTELPVSGEALVVDYIRAYQEVVL